MHQTRMHDELQTDPCEVEARCVGRKGLRAVGYRRTLVRLKQLVEQVEDAIQAIVTDGPL